MDRRHGLDWLRVLLFALLVPHHAALGFVDWGADIYRFTNNHLAGDGMTFFIYWSHSWRLPSLFLIAGIGTWFLTRGGIGPRFMAARASRVMIPAIFGTFFLNVFGGYAMARMTGARPGFLSFWRGWLLSPEPGQIQHLWFLLNLVAWKILLVAALLFLVKAALLTIELQRDVPTGQVLAAGGWVPLGLEPRHAALFSVVEAATAWTWSLAALGLAARYLRRSGRWLPELNRAVFPVYVMHFPVTIIGLAIVAGIAAPWPAEFVLLVAGIYVGTWVLWRIVDQLGPLAMLVGGRPRRMTSLA
jgi:hypothetical protein